MKRKILNLFVFIFLVAGICVFFWPSVEEQKSKRQSDQVLETFEAERGNDYSALYEQLQVMNRALYENRQAALADPFSMEIPAVDLSDYGYDSNVIGQIEIPKMDISLPIYLGASHQNMLKGIAQISQTSFPIGGKNTNCVLAGHRGWNKAVLFRNIDLLEAGDDVYITNLWDTLHYKVTGIRIILPDQINEILIQPGKDMVTLMSCEPYRVNTHRYLVFCERYDETLTGADESAAESTASIQNDAPFSFDHIPLNRIENWVRTGVGWLLVTALAVWLISSLLHWLKKRKMKD